MKRIVLFVLMLSVLSCSKSDPKPGKQNESIQIKGLVNSQTIHNNESYKLTSETKGEITSVEYYFDGASIGSSISSPFTFNFEVKDQDAGDHKITAVAKLSGNTEYRSEISVKLVLRLGDEFRGGRIFHIASDNKTGLIASNNDFQTSTVKYFRWGKSGLLLNATSDDGAENTKKLAETVPENHASDTFIGYYFKNGLKVNGFSDWYLPSLKETEILLLNRQFVSNFPKDNAQYWTSTEINATDAYCKDWIGSMHPSMDKTLYINKIRLIRKF